MKALTAFASAAAVAIALSAASAPAHAAVFAQFSPGNSKMDYRWIKSGGVGPTAGTGGHFFSITPTTQNATTAQAVNVSFSYLDPALSALAFLPAKFTIDANVTNSLAHVASKNSSGIFTQTNVDGHFNFIFSGATGVYGGHLLTNGVTNLLSGVFTNAWIQGGGGSGSTNVAVGNGGSASYTSDIEHFAHLIPGTQEFAFNLLAAQFGAVGCPVAGGTCTKALNSFRANGGGNFSFLASAPEPATWGLMMVGFGGLGMVLRNRRRTAIARA